MDEIYNERLKKADHFAWGQYVHKIFEDGYQLKTFEELKELAKSLEKNYKFKKSRLKDLDNYLRNFLILNSNLYKTVAVEDEFSIEIKMPCAEKPVNVIGYIDRVVQGINGRYLVLDYKTSKTEKTRLDLGKDEQMKMYAIACSIKYNCKVDEVLVGHFYPKSGNTVVVRYPHFTISTFKGEVVRTVAEANNQLIFKPNRNKFCNWCEFKNICPLFGTPQFINEELKKFPTSKP